MKLRLLIIGLLLFALGTASQAAVYVKWDAPGCGDGNTWATAYKTIQEAVNDPRTDTEPIYVAGATKQQQKADPAAGVHAKVVLLTGVEIYGGYEGVGEPGKRDAKKWISTIKLGQTGSAVTAANNTVIDGFRIVTTANGVDVSGMSGVAITGNEIVGEGTGDTYGVYCIASAANIEISSNRITKCAAGTYLESVWALVVKNNRVVANRLAGICAVSSQVSIEQNYVASNCIEAECVYGSTYGDRYAGVCVFDSSGIVNCNVIAGNQDTGLFLETSGAAIISNNTIVQNSTGLYGSGNIRNNIIAYNTIGVATSNAQGYSNNVFGNGSGYTINPTLNGNISQDPQFLDLEHGDLRLKSTSPCRDTGSVFATPIADTDFDGHARIWPTPGNIDIGAYEYDGTYDPLYHRVYVNSSSQGGDGSSWEQAFATITEGMAAIEGTGGEVWVANGLYTENIAVGPFIQLYGGFDGNEANLGDRPAPFSGARQSIIDGSGRSSVVVMHGQSVLDGFTVRNGSGYLQPNIYPKAIYGGGIFCGTASPIIRNNTITANSALTGGGICCFAKSSATITKNRIIGNRAKDGGGILCKFSSSVTISSNMITGNGAGKFLAGQGYGGSGGGILADQSNVKVLSNTITGNDAGFHQGTGGGVFVSKGSVVVANNVVAANGGADVGSGIYVGSATVSLINNTIVANNGRRAYSSWSCSTYLYSTTGVVANNIIAFNSGGIGSTGTVTAKNNNVYGNSGANYYMSDMTGINGNISQDPRLTNWQLGHVMLTSTSPCMNAGDSSVVQPDWVDVASNPRVQDGTVDIGAYEYYAGQSNSPSSIVVRVSPSGDDNNDGLSWDKPKQTLQTAIDAVSAVGGEVWVSAGTYNENIQLRPYVQLLGGFAGVETESSQRNWNANRTIIDGGLKGSVVTITHGGVPDVPLSSLDGFTIQNGSGTRVDGECSGSGIFCQFASTKVSHCIVTNNGASTTDPQYGAGMYYTDGALPIVTSNIVTRNGARPGWLMHAIHCSFIDHGVMANNVVIDNGSATAGTGMVFNYAAMKVVNNIVTGNPYGLAYNQPSAGAVFTNNDSYGNKQNYNISPIPAGNYSFDPMFKDPANGDYHLKPSSPCIDAGNSTYYADSDMSGAICPQDGNGDGTAIADIGIYETPLNLSAAKKNYTDGSSIALGGAAVTAQFPGYVYVESLNRSSGIKVATPETPAIGSVVNVSGTITVDQSTGEAYIAASTGWPRVSAGKTQLAPFGLNIPALGGGKLGLQNSVWGLAKVTTPGGTSTLDYSEASGLNNIGLLVRVCGKVSSVGDDGNSFCISDGANIYADTRTKGIRVDTTGIPMNLAPGQLVVVTGISSCEKTYGDKILRLLKPRSSADIQLLQ